MNCSASTRSECPLVPTVIPVIRRPSRCSFSTPAFKRTSLPLAAIRSAIRSESRPKPFLGYMKRSMRLMTFPLDGMTASFTAVRSDIPLERCDTQSPLISLQGSPQTFSEYR